MKVVITTLSAFIFLGGFLSCGGGGQHCEAYGKADYRSARIEHSEKKSEQKITHQHSKSRTEIPYRNK